MARNAQVIHSLPICFDCQELKPDMVVSLPNADCVRAGIERPAVPRYLPYLGYVIPPPPVQVFSTP